MSSVDFAWKGYFDLREILMRPIVVVSETYAHVVRFGDSVRGCAVTKVASARTAAVINARIIVDDDQRRIEEFLYARDRCEAKVCDKMS